MSKSNGRSLSRCGRAALKYAERGWFVLPLKPNSKEPLGALVARGYRDATNERDQIRDWWSEYPDANVGIALGRPYGLIAIDVDGPDGADELRRLEREYGALPPTRESTSGRPHRKHLLFRYPKDYTVRRIVKVNNTALDVLTDGYIVAPPSTHPKTGKAYRWLQRNKTASAPHLIRDLSASTSASIANAASENIPEGQRNDTLTRSAGSMRRRGLSEKAILAALLVDNEERCVPPLSEREVRNIARSIAKKKPVPLAFDQPLNDSLLAERFAAIEKDDLRYCPAWRQWLLWDGRRWATDITLQAERRVEEMIRAMFELLPHVSDEKTRKDRFNDLNKYANHKRLGDVLARARSRLVVTPDQLNADPWLFNVANGTVDLKTGALRPHTPSDLITKLAPVTYDAKASAPRWHDFLNAVMKEDAELVKFMQYAVGYSLTGVTHEHVLLFCYGDGRNGKSTFLEVLQELFGDYAVTIDFETLLHQRYKSSEARRDLPRLDKARLVTANETPTNARWDEATVKQLTGGDTLSGRWLYGEKFEFRPTHTIWARANAQPDSRDQSEGFWSRVRLIPFRRKFLGEQQIKDLRERLIEELPGILNWALKGCRLWQRDGALPLAQRVERATAKYREEQDDYGLFIEARCERDENARTSTDDLYTEFTDWWRVEHGSRSAAPSARAFGKGLAKQPDIQSIRFKRNGVKARGWRGIKVRNV